MSRIYFKGYWQYTESVLVAWNGQCGLGAIFGLILDILKFAFLCLAKSCLQWYHLSTSLQWLCRGCCLSVMALPGCGCLLHWHHLFTRLLPAYNGIIETLGCCLQNHHLFARLLYACSSSPFPWSKVKIKLLLE